MVILEISYNKRWNIIITFENVSQFSTQRSNGNKHDKILFLDSRQHYHIIKSTTQHRNRHCLYISWAINTTTFQRSSAKIKNQFYLSIYRKKPISKLISTASRAHVYKYTARSYIRYVSLYKISFLSVSCYDLCIPTARTRLT